MAEIYKQKTFLQIYDAMKRYLVGESSALNNFNTGSRLSVLLEAVALVLAQTHNDFYQGLKIAIPTSVYNAFDFERNLGIAAAGTIEFTRSSPATEDYTIPIGTAIVLNGIKFETTAVGSILTGNTSSGNINAQCSVVGVDGNISSGAIDTSLGQGSFVNQPDGVEAATNNVAFTGGTNEESDEDRISRFRLFVNSLPRSTVQGLIAGALSVDGVVSATVVENNPTLGWVTIYADDGTGTLSTALKEEIEKVINGDPNDTANYLGYRPAGVLVQVLAPTVQSVDVTVDIKILDSSLSDPADLKSLAQTAIENYVNTLRLGYDVIITEIIHVIKEAHNDIYDVDVTLPAANVTITDDKVARTGTVTVTHSIVSI